MPDQIVNITVKVDGLKPAATENLPRIVFADAETADRSQKNADELFSVYRACRAETQGCPEQFELLFRAAVRCLIGIDYDLI